MSFSDSFRVDLQSRTPIRLLAVAMVAAVLLLCFLPFEFKSALHTRGRLHSAGHLVVFLALAYVLNRTSRSPMVRLGLFIGVLAIGFGTEFGEHFFFGTLIEWKDVAVDAIGAMAGTLLARLSSRRRRKSLI